MTIGKILAALMKQYGVNALDLERLTGVPSSTIYRLLKNKAGNPTIEVLKKLSSFFQISVSQFIGEETIGGKQAPFVSISELEIFIKNKFTQLSDYRTIQIELPLSPNCFATNAYDTLMEPFILKNSVIIIDPDRELATKDFALLLKEGQKQPKLRQIIKNDDEIYLKVLNPDFSIPLEKLDQNEYLFIGTIVHYRTNLLNFDHGVVSESRPMNYDTKEISAL